MQRLLHLVIIFLLTTGITRSQAQVFPFLETVPGLHMPKDTTVSDQLLHSFNDFLGQKDLPARENKYVWQPEYIATAALLDELKGVEKNNVHKDGPVYKAYLTNVAPMPDNKYLLQCSYMGTTQGKPDLKASFRLMAIRTDTGFRFYAPFAQHTRGWQQRTTGNITFYYKDFIDTVKMESYRHYNELYEAKLGMTGHTTRLYCCNGLSEVLQLIGVDFQADYNGNNYGSVSINEPKVSFSVNGTLKPDFRNFDPHDMWHAKLKSVLAQEKINKAVDEGCAFLYGGSWGLSWQDIKAVFKTYRLQHPDADWLQLYTQGVDFKEGQQPLKVSYFINALIVQQLEKEKGFSSVMSLLACGPQEKEHENYFKTLQILTGISKKNFNARVTTMVQSL